MKFYDKFAELNTHNCHANVLTFVDNEILEMYNHFKKPLENTGFTGDSGKVGTAYLKSCSQAVKKVFGHCAGLPLY